LKGFVLALTPISGQPIPATRPIADPRASAQRAFFEAALGRAQAAPQAAPPPPTSHVQTTSPVAAPRAPVDVQRPDPSARPGLLVNITV
jgi:hypothetical protein